jgi:hypothetical protein
MGGSAHPTAMAMPEADIDESLRAFGGWTAAPGPPEWPSGEKRQHFGDGNRQQHRGIAGLNIDDFIDGWH